MRLIFLKLGLRNLAKKMTRSEIDNFLSCYKIISSKRDNVSIIVKKYLDLFYPYVKNERKKKVNL